MSDETTTPETPAPAAKAKKGPLIIAVVAASVIGGGAGVAFIGPKLATPASAAAAGRGSQRLDTQ